MKKTSHFYHLPLSSHITVGAFLSLNAEVVNGQNQSLISNDISSIIAHEFRARARRHFVLGIIRLGSVRPRE